ncbi:MAG: anti-sigma factor antagonist [Planctomycetaceae bacterium]|nr:MAG: anti-sigma factor antagonist [Planctomycetaceae bacterium]
MLQIQARQAGEVTVVKLSGQLIYGTESQSLAQHVKQQLAAGKIQLLVDLAEVGFIDSNGVGELVSSFSSTKRAGGHFKLCSPQKMVREVLRIVRLPTMIEMFDTADQALASFATTAP